MEEAAELEMADEVGEEESIEEDDLEDLFLKETADTPLESEPSEPHEELVEESVGKTSSEESAISFTSEEELLPEEEVGLEKEVGELDEEVVELELADEVGAEESVEEEDLEDLFLKETAEIPPLEPEPSESHEELIEESVDQADSEEDAIPVRSEEQQEPKSEVSLHEKAIIEGIEEIDIKGELEGEDDILPHVQGEEIPLEEISLSSIATFRQHSPLDLTLEDFGISEPFSDELISNEMTQNISQMVEKITTSLALPVVERVAREIALKRSEEIINEEIDRIKGTDTSRV